MKSKLGISVTLNLVEGEHAGIRIAEVTGWAGYALAGPRSSLKDLLTLKDLDRTGVYILAGLDKKSGRLRVYIGESNSLIKRVKYHHTEGKKKFWTQTYCFANKDKSFNKALALYVESELVARVKKAGRVVIANTTSPDKPDLAMDAVFQAEHFLEKIAVVLPALGLDILSEKPWPVSPEPPGDGSDGLVVPDASDENPDPDPSDATELNGSVWLFMGARARILGRKTIVLTGSPAVKWIGKGAKGYRYIQEQLASKGILRWHSNSEKGEFTRDYTFASSSAAAAIVSGRSASGPASWVNELTGKTLKDSVSDKTTDSLEPIFTMQLPKIGIQAAAHLNKDLKGLTILQGSIVRGSWVGKNKSGPKGEMLEKLVSDKSIRRTENGLAVFQRDVSFSSPSAAARIVAGTVLNGKKAWRHQESGESLGDWLQRHPTES